MKIVVFAHTPPPHHGQSYMVELMLRGFADPTFGIKCFHVNARFSSGPKDLSRFGFGKILRLFGYCAKAVCLRFSKAAPILYYIPSPPLRVPLFRDWLILLLLRPFFQRVIFHWHAAGLGEWIETQPAWIKIVSRRLLKGADLSISLGSFNERDAALFQPRRSVIVPNGIPDPVSNFAEIARERRARLEGRTLVTENPTRISVLFLGLLIKEKGFIDAMRGIAIANLRCRERKIPFEFHLSIAGSFLAAESEKLFHEVLVELGNPSTIRHLGFLGPEAKARALAEADILCFPTYYFAESFGLVIIEAMAFGLPIVSTRWRSIPDLFPVGYPGLVDIQSPDQIADALITLATRDDSDEFRRRFLEKFTQEQHLQTLADAFRQV